MDLSNTYQRRAYYAGCALTGLLARPINAEGSEVVQDALQCADAMISAEIDAEHDRQLTNVISSVKN